MERRRITIITVVRNAAEALASTIQSIVVHLSPGVEYIIIDGASTDGTLEVIRHHESALKTWRSAPDKGVYDAMNQGWGLADPDSWILYLGAGDKLLSLPGRMERADSSREIVYGNVNLDRGEVFHAKDGFWLKLYNSLHHQALLVPKSLHTGPPFDLAYPLYADFDFNQRLLKQGATFRFAPDFRTYATPGGLTRTLEIDELAAVTRKNFGRFWSGLARTGFALSQCLPPIRKLRPIRRDVNAQN